MDNKRNEIRLISDQNILGASRKQWIEWNNCIYVTNKPTETKLMHILGCLRKQAIEPKTMNALAVMRHNKSEVKNSQEGVWIGVG